MSDEYDPHMATMGFLRSVFPQRHCKGFVRFVTGTPGNFPEATYFLSVDDLYLLDQLPFETQDKEVFFTPHTFKDASGRCTKDNAETCMAAWIECDDEDFSPLSILPYTPSAVIQTSPRRTHAYWFLSAPEEGPLVETLNRALAYKYLTKDVAGWALTKLLRVPGFFNGKYDPPAPVMLLTFEPERRYTVGDFAGDLDLDGQRNHINGASGDDLAVPEFNNDVRQAILAELGDSIPLSVQQLLTVEQRDRSRALWHVSNWALRAGLTKEQCFQLLWSSPNNKFAESRFNGPEGLWRDICSAWRNYTSIDRPKAVAKIRQLRSQRGLPPEVRYEEVAKLVYRTMASEGSFYYDAQTKGAYFYTHSPAALISLGVQSADCQTYLGTAYSLNGTTQEYKFVAEYLRAQCEAEAQRIKMRDLAHYNAKHNLLYVTDFKGGVYRLDGNTIELVYNGVDDGVFFKAVCPSDAYTPDFSAPPQLLDKLFDSVRLQDVNYPEEQARFLIRTWFAALFFGELFETRPLLVLEGPKGSGKSTAFKVIEWLIRGEPGCLYSMPGDPRGYKQATRTRTYMFFDGVDEPFKGLSELLSVTATGTVDRQRILYTDNRMAEYELRAFVGITTMNAYWMRHDVADRAIILRAARRKSFTSESELKAAALQHRNQYWGALLQYLNQIVATLRTHTAPQTRLRMADFAKFLSTLCAMHQVDFKDHVRFLKAEQEGHILRKVPVWETLSKWLARPGNYNRRVTPYTLHQELLILGAQHQTDYARAYGNHRLLLNALMMIQSSTNMESTQHEGQQVLYFLPVD